MFLVIFFLTIPGSEQLLESKDILQILKGLTYSSKAEPLLLREAAELTSECIFVR